MTTIAWDGETIASDSLASNMHRESMGKLFEHQDGSVMGVTGNYQIALAAVAYLRNEGPKPEIPKDDGFKLLRVYPDGHGELYESLLLPMFLTRSYFSIGSGQDYALTAMHLGLTAKQAVELAIEFDEHSGGAVMVFDVVPKTLRAVESS